MANYILTNGNDVLTGTAGADTFDGYFHGAPGGIDELNGGLGNDRFVLGSIENYYTVDGGGGIDTVYAQGNDFGYASFVNVETLDVRSGAIALTSAQLAAFATVTDSVRPGERIDVFGVADINLRPNGSYEVFDFSTRVTGAYSVSFKPGGDTVRRYSVVGTANADVLEGRGYADKIDGAGGSDVIRGGDYDLLYGGGGDDRFELRLDVGLGVVDGGAGVDTIVVSGNNFDQDVEIRDMTLSSVEVLDARVATFMTVSQFYSFKYIVNNSGPGSRVGVHFSDVNGASVNLGSRIVNGHSASASVDNGTLIGTAFNDYLAAGSGNEVLVGGEGNDVLANGDFVLGGTGRDILNGGAGNDRFEISGGKGVVYGGTGSDTVVPLLRDSLGDFIFKDVETLDASLLSMVATLSQLSSFHRIVTSDSSKTVSFLLTGSGGSIDFSKKITGQLSVWVQGQSNSSAINIVGTANGDLLDGTGYNDILKGGNGADILLGSDGNDRLAGGAGQDQLDGGAGNDVFELESGFDTVTDFAGTDTISSTIRRDLMQYATIENLVVGGTAAINGNGNNLNNALYGNAAANWLSGGNGNDMLYGGAGKDTLTGGAGNDVFVFNTALNAATNVDVIRDFNVAADTIRLDNAVMAGLGPVLGTLAAGKFWKSTSGLAHDADDRIIYETDTGKLFYDANGKASGGAVHIATLAANLALTNADFVVI